MPLLAVALSITSSGCVIIEANIRAVDVLARDDSTSAQKGIATAVVGATAAVLTGLAVAATVTATTDWTIDEPPPSDYVSSEYGWKLARVGDEVSWMRCTSRIFCTEERATVDAADLLEMVPAGRVIPVAMGGRALEEVELLALKVRRRR